MSMTSTLKRKHVLRIIMESPKPLSPKEIRKALGLPPSANRIIRAFIQSLLKKGKILNEGNFYMSHAVANARNERMQDLKKNIHYKKSDSHEKGSSERQPKKRPKHLTKKGTFCQTKSDVAFVIIGPQEPDILIPKQCQANAVDGDIVEVAITAKGRKRIRGEVVKVLEHRNRFFVGKIRRLEQQYVVNVLQKRSPFEYLVIKDKKDLLGAKPNDWVQAEWLVDDSSEYLASGKVTRVLDEHTSDKIAQELVLSEQQIVEAFPEEVVEQAQAFPNRVIYDSKSKRTDLRKVPLVTIDGESARDFDDAVCAQKQEDGSYKLWVAIADVAHYVKHNSPIDQEAYARGTSVYLPTRAIPMLPEELSNGLCSLKPRVNRYAMTCEIDLDPNGKVLKSQIYESVIKSHARLTYTQVQAFMDGERDQVRPQTVHSSLDTMIELYQILKTKRAARGAIAFNFPEYEVQFGNNEQVTGFHKRFQSDSMSLIEQFMLEANEAVAEYAVQKNLPVLYRVHGQPDLNKLQKLQPALHLLGVDLPTKRFLKPITFNEAFEALKDHPLFPALQTQLLKSMALAIYAPENEGHFGLGADYYAHFTSPIRRYPDLILHRAIKQSLHQKKGTLKLPEASNDVAVHLSQQERRADSAENQSVLLAKIQFLQNKLGQALEAEVLSISDGRIEIEIAPYHLTWQLDLGALNDDFYVFKIDNLSLSGRRTGRDIQVGQKLEVQVARVDIMERKAEFVFSRWVDAKKANTKAKTKTTETPKKAKEVRKKKRKS